jgi:CubicO group peptidase (beta-lactamase class C family)
MSNLHDILQTHVSNGSMPGAVALVARGDRVEVQAAGFPDVDGTCPMGRDSIFRIASITKPITAAAVMMLVEDGRIALEDPVGHWLPELASPSVVRTPASPVDDVVPAVRPITVASPCPRCKPRAATSIAAPAEAALLANPVPHPRASPSRAGT